VLGAESIASTAFAGVDLVAGVDQLLEGLACSELAGHRVESRLWRAPSCSTDLRPADEGRAAAGPGGGGGRRAARARRVGSVRAGIELGRPAVALVGVVESAQRFDEAVGVWGPVGLRAAAFIA
jgi:hypothetical protein